MAGPIQDAARVARGHRSGTAQAATGVRALHPRQRRGILASGGGAAPMPDSPSSIVHCPLGLGLGGGGGAVSASAGAHRSAYATAPSAAPPSGRQRLLAARTRRQAAGPLAPDPGHGLGPGQGPEGRARAQARRCAGARAEASD